MKKLLILLLFLISLLPVKSYGGNFFITSYSFNDSEAATITNKYDFIITDPSESSALSTMKGIRSSIIAIYNKNALTYGTANYVLDVNTGKRCVHKTWGWYLHDISNANYRSALANDILSTLNTYPQFDGVFLDDVGISVSASDFYQEGTTQEPTLPPDLVTNWRSAMLALIQNVKSAIGPKILILNTSWAATDYLGQADGIMDENFSHANWDGPNDFLGPASWINHLNALKNAAANSKYYLAQSGVSDGATQDQIAKLVRYSFSSFLMGIPSNNSFAKHYFCPSINYTNQYWYTDWDVKIGNPVGDYFQMPGTTIYRRNFDNGIVIVNPTAQAANITLEKNYCNSAGQSISQISVSDHEGSILLDCAKDLTIPAPPKGVKVIN